MIAPERMRQDGGDLGCVTGRFQPPHEGHLELMELALLRHDSVALGITNPDPSARAPNDAHPGRHLASANPFTYFERVLLLRAMLNSREISPNRFIIVPFPLGVAIDCSDYVPREAVQYVRVYSDWELHKVELLRDYGYPVHVVQPVTEKRWSAATIRKSMIAGSAWRDMVPVSTLPLLDSFLAQRSIQQRG